MTTPPDLSKIRPLDLVNNPSILLHGARPDQPIGPFDGRVGAVVDQGRHFVTSPNTDIVYKPHLDRVDVRMREDFRYGPYDPTLWAQPYNEEYCHFAAMFRKPEFENMPFSLLYQDLKTSNFDPLDNTVSNGLGHPNQNIIKLFGELYDQLNGEIEEYKIKTPQESRHEHIFLLARALSDAKTCFTQLALTFEQLQFSWTDVQRLFIETKASLDYHSIYHQRMIGLKRPPTHTENMMGTVTTDPTVVQFMFRAGLPVWYLRPWGLVASARIDKIVQPFQPLETLFAKQANPPLPIVYSGFPNDKIKYQKMQDYHRNFYRPPVPYFQFRESSTLATSSRDTAEKSRARANEIKNPNIDYFTHKLCPLIANSWKAALGSILPSFTRAKNFGHLFPHAALLLRITTDEKRLTYIFNWLRFRPTLLYRLTKPDAVIEGYPNDFWRVLLTYGGETAGENQGGQRAQARQKAAELLQSCGVPTGMLSNATTVRWRATTISQNQPLDQDTLTRIIWEINELNFRFDLYILHRRRKSNNGDEVSDPDALLMDCFPTTGPLNIVDGDKANAGLGSLSSFVRLRYLVHLAHVFEGWLGCPDIVMSAASAGIVSVRHWTAQEIGKFETRITKFFVETFEREFGRLPSVPWSLDLSDRRWQELAWGIIGSLSFPVKK
ncbi:hypothetical protein BDN72DRAFT_894858 [Pluteus cervinus]|uniref:Uncharacterized protein n=1 Tax=Pluteus cervinus TaxID=181527 RepID=A0ACD3B2X9_9AGAR|nr:hypothetical protein BDN72DRAFT_894858 [Pluteus cervinus]